MNTQRDRQVRGKGEHTEGQVEVRVNTQRDRQVEVRVNTQTDRGTE